MTSVALTDPMELKVRELLKEVQLDCSPAFTKLVDETVSAIKEAIDKIPEDIQECFHDKDYLNFCYHAKRCLYLSIVKKYLKLSSVPQKPEWSTFQNEARKPILVVHPAMKLIESPQFLVRIIPAATSVFNVSKLNLELNNIRALNQGGVLQATLKYNSSILDDLFLEENAEFVKRTFFWMEGTRRGFDFAESLGTAEKFNICP